MNLFIWVQHLFGRGHIRRMARIAEACAAAPMRVTVVAGGPGGRLAFADLKGVTAHQLPALGTADAEYTALQTAHGDSPDETFWALRREALLAALASSAPDVVMVELFPFGRRKFAGEVLALIEAAKALPTPPLIVSSVRDIVEPKAPAKRAEMAGWLATHFDAALVHGDASFIELEETAPFAAKARLHYTGYIAPALPTKEKRGVVVSAGSSPTGQALLLSAAKAAESIASAKSPWDIFVPPGIAAPNAVSSHVTIHPYTDKFVGALASAEVSISEAGYNTFAEVLSAGTRPVFVPYAEAGQTEQSIRATRAAARGLGVTPGSLEPEALIEATARARTLPKARPLDLSGAAHTAVILQGLRGGSDPS